MAHETGHFMWNHRNRDSWFAFDEGVQPNDCGPQAGHFETRAATHGVNQ